MTDRVALVKSFLASLRPSGDGKITPRADLLTEDATFEALLKLSGRNAVIERMTADTTGRVYREVTWAEPEKYGNALKVIGRTPPGSLMGGAVLVFHFAGDRISVIQHQPIPGAPMPAGELKLSPELKALVNSALLTRHPMLMSYVDESGQPVLSFRGSTQTFSDDQLAIWIRNADGNLLRSVAKNPKVAFMYRNEDTKETFQFQGRGWVATGEAERRRVYDNAPPVERAHDFARTGVALIVDLDLVEGWFGLTPDGPIGRVRMLRGRRSIARRWGGLASLLQQAGVIRRPPAGCAANLGNTRDRLLILLRHRTWRLVRLKFRVQYGHRGRVRAIARASMR